MTKRERTKVGDAIQTANARWTFGGDVSSKFDEHVERSVPLYGEGHDLVVKLSDFFVQDDSTVYELGCSTGALLAALAERHADRPARFVGIDREQGMVDRATARLGEVRCQDLLDIELEPADLIVSYYTLQFVRPKHRQLLFDRIYKALHWGGAFLLFEKVRAPDARFQDICAAVYSDYKLDRGYDPEEIVAKARSLKGVLEPFSTEGNLDLLSRAGFVDSMSVLKYVCFEGFLAIK